MKLIPPHYFLISFALMLALNFAAPAARWLNWPWTLIGILPLAFGLSLTSGGAILFTRRGTPIKPFTTSTTLVTDGPYRFTRNPMYLGLLLMLLGIATLLGTVTPLIVIPVFVWIISSQFIAKEEAMLSERFGEPYAEYCRRVRRWI